MQSNYQKMAYGKFNVDYEQRIDFSKMRADKTERAVKCLRDDDIVAVMTFNADNIRYLTSAYITTPNRAGEYQFASFTVNGQSTLYSGIPEEAKRRMPWLNGRVKPNLGGSALKTGANDGTNISIQRQVETVMQDILDSGLSPKDGYIGIDGTAIPHAYIDGFERAGCKCKMANRTLDKARAIKTSEEIKIMRIVAANTEFAFADIVDAIRPGIREQDLVGIGLKALYSQGIDHSEDLVCMSGENTNPYNWSFTDKPIRPGDLIYIDVDAASYLGYKSCVYRTFCCGKATQSQKDKYRQCLDYLRAGIDACTLGKTNYDIQRAFPWDPSIWGHDSLATADPYMLAHGCGLTLHDRPFTGYSYINNGGEEIPLEPGMVIAVETYAGHKDDLMGVRLEDMVLITETGNEVLSRWPVDELMECWLPYAPNTYGLKL